MPALEVVSGLVDVLVAQGTCLEPLVYSTCRNNAYYSPPPAPPPGGSGGGGGGGGGSGGDSRNSNE